MIRILEPGQSEEALARFGMRWRGNTEAISRIDDLLPSRYVAVVRIVNGIQLVSVDEEARVGQLLRQRPSALTRTLLRELGLLGRAEPFIGELRPSQLAQVLYLLAGPDDVLCAHYWAGSPDDVSVPTDRVVQGTRGDLLDVSAQIRWRPPASIWSSDLTWAMVTYTDAPSTYLGLEAADRESFDPDRVAMSTWADRGDPIDDWMAPDMEAGDRGDTS